jgi:hypothetical protein
VEKISFGNREYVKASQAAKRFKYTQDYVGQLCRGKKVDARLVGRVWYVNLESITQYRKTKHETQKKAAKDTTAPKSKTTKSAVESVVRPKTARKLQEAFPKEAKQAVRHVAATYSRDKTSIIPVLGSRDVIQSTEKATPKEKRSIIIKVRPNTKKSTRYVTEKVPDISLSGKLILKESSDETERKQQVAARNLLAANSSQQPTRSDPRPAVHAAGLAKQKPVVVVPTSKPLPQPTTSNFISKQVQASNSTRTNNIGYSDWFLVASLLLSICSALVILSMASLGQISPTTYNSWSLVFDFAQLKNFVF